MPDFGSFGQGLDPGALQAVSEALARRGVGGGSPAIGQVSSQAPSVPNPATPAIAPSTGPSIPRGSAMGGGGEAPIILKALIERLKQNPVG